MKPSKTEDRVEASHGGCLCGAVRFVATPINRNVGVCHCNMCRRWSAGPLLYRDAGSAVKFDDSSHLGIYRSSEWAERGFCKRCGTPLFYRFVATNSYSVMTEAFDDTAGLELTSQIFIDEKPAYYDFANVTKTMTGAEWRDAFSNLVAHKILLTD